jgi:hypothetical protein
MLWRLLLPAGVASLITALSACGSGDNDPAPSLTPSPTALFDVPNPEYPEGSNEKQILDALLSVYADIAAPNYESAWDRYTEAYRNTCSFEGYVDTWDRTREAFGWDELLIRGVTISVDGEQANASFTVYPKANGEILPGSAYSHKIPFERENDQWLAFDRCY